MYERAGVRAIVVPGALVVAPTGLIGRPLPMRAPPRTQRAISAFSAVVRMRCDWPRYAGESCPGIQGGMRPSCVMTRMRLAYAFASRGDRSENGAMPPGVWQPAHFCANTGPTSAHVGAAA